MSIDKVSQIFGRFRAKSTMQRKGSFGERSAIYDTALLKADGLNALNASELKLLFISNIKSLDQSDPHFYRKALGIFVELAIRHEYGDLAYKDTSVLMVIEQIVDKIFNDPELCTRYQMLIRNTLSLKPDT